MIVRNFARTIVGFATTIVMTATLAMTVDASAIATTSNDVCWITLDRSKIIATRAKFRNESILEEFTVIGDAKHDFAEHFQSQSTRESDQRNACNDDEWIKLLRFDDERTIFMIPRDNEKFTILTYDTKQFVRSLKRNISLSSLSFWPSKWSSLFSASLSSSPLSSSSLLSDLYLLPMARNNNTLTIDKLFRVPTHERMTAWTLTNDRNVKYEHVNRCARHDRTRDDRNKHDVSVKQFVLLTGNYDFYNQQRNENTRSNYLNNIKLCIHRGMIANGTVVPLTFSSPPSCSNRTIRYSVAVSSVNSRFCAHSIRTLYNDESTIFTFVIERRAKDNRMRIWLYKNESYVGSFNLPNCTNCFRVSPVERISTRVDEDDKRQTTDELWSMRIIDRYGKSIGRLWTFASIVDNRVFMTRYDDVNDKESIFNLREKTIETSRRLIALSDSIELARSLISIKFYALDDELLILDGNEFCRSSVDLLRECVDVARRSNTLDMRTVTIVPKTMRTVLREYINKWYNVPCTLFDENLTSYDEIISRTIATTTTSVPYVSSTINSISTIKPTSTIVLNENVTDKTISIDLPNYDRSDIPINSSFDNKNNNTHLPSFTEPFESSTDTIGTTVMLIARNNTHHNGTDDIRTLNNNILRNFIILMTFIVGLLLLSIGIFSVVIIIYVRFE